MPVYFFDTSAIVKQYHEEGGASEVKWILSEKDRNHYISRLSTVEVHSAFARKAFNKEIDFQALQILQKSFANDISSRNLKVLRMLHSRYHEAERLIRKRTPTKNLRTLDALQLSIALDLYRRFSLDYFVCADSRLCRIAQDEGLISNQS